MSTSASQDSSPRCKICLDNPLYPLAKNIELFYDRLRKDGLTDAILMAERVINPNVVQPTPLDTYTIAGEVYLRYPKEVNTQRMTPAALEEFLKAGCLATTKLEKRDDMERALVKDMLSYIGDDVKMRFNMLPGALAARDSNDPYQLYPFLVRSWTGEGAARAAQYLDKIVNFKQTTTMSHIQYAEEMRENQRTFLKLVEDPAQAGVIRSNTLLSLLYLRGLDPVRQAYILQTIFSAVDRVQDLPDPEELINQVQIFVQNFNPEQHTEPSAAYVAKSVKVPDDVKSGTQDKLCACGARFAPAQSFWSRCAACQLAKKKVSKAKPAFRALQASSVVPPVSFTPVSLPYGLAGPPSSYVGPTPLTAQQFAMFTPEVQRLMAYQAAGLGQYEDDLSVGSSYPGARSFQSFVARANVQKPEFFAMQACAADSACTLHCTGTLSRLSSPEVLAAPILLSGIGDSAVYLTHVGFDANMPLGHRNLYYGPRVGADLISLGYLSRTGRCAYVQDVDGVLRVFFDGALLFSAPRQANNLYPVDSLALVSHPSVKPACLMLDADYLRLNASVASMTTGLSIDFLDSLLARTRVVVDPLSHVSAGNLIQGTSYLSSAIKPLVNRSMYHFNNEQRQRIDQADELVKFLHYPSTESVATAVSMGSFSSYSPLDAKDFHNLQRLKGYSPHYLAGHFKKKPMTTSSTTPPASQPGQVLTMDIHELKVPSINGFTHMIQVVSEYEGYIAIIPAKSKSSKDLFDAIHNFISTVYNAKSYRCDSAHADAEGVMKSMKAQFGSIGITLTLSPPGQHAQRSERYTQTLEERMRSTLDSLSYELPNIAVAHSMNLTPNSRSFPLSPYEKVNQRRCVFHSKYPFLPFGTVCMVSMGDSKRSALASTMVYPKHAVSKAEIGVLLGVDPAFPGSYMFYIDSTRTIVPRNVVKPLNSSVIPFNWKPKVSLFSTLQQFPVDLTVRQDRNVVVQPRLNPNMELPPSQYADQPIRVKSIIPQFVSFVNAIPQSVTQPSPVEQTLLGPRTPEAVVQRPAFSILPTVVPAPPLVINTVVPVMPTPIPFVSPVSLPSEISPLAVEPLILRRFTRGAPTVQPPTLPLRVSSRSNKGKPYVSSGAYISVPVCNIAENICILPPCTGYVVKSRQPSTPLLTVKPRSRAYSATFASNTQKIAAKIANKLPVYNFGRVSPPVVVAPSIESAFLGILYEPGFERTQNLYNLAPDVLDHVAFLADLPVADIPAGLHLPLAAMHEIPYIRALKDPMKYPPDQLKASLVKEIAKMVERFGALEIVVDKSQINPDAIYVSALLLSKVKYLADGAVDRITTRFALNGTMQKEGDFGDTYAPTPDNAAMLLCMSAFQAHALKHGYAETLAYESFDVDSAFLQCDLVSKRQILTKIPDNIDHPLAGKLCIVRKSVYGLRQANKAFADDFSNTIISAGFTKCIDPCIYKKIIRCRNGVTKRCYVSTHVDDGKAMFNCRDIYDHLITVLEKRYGPLKKQPLSSYTGTNFIRHSNGAFSFSQEGYILRFLESVNVPGLVISKVPSNFDLFEDTSKSPLCDVKLYRSIIGSLIHTLITRYDCQKEVVHLSGQMKAPTVADLAKAVLVLRYLAGTAKLGPTYYTKQGPTLVCYVDCSYGVHADGRSHGGFSLHIGSDNAPFFVNSKRQSECVAVGSMESEYVTLSSAARKVLEFRYLLEDLEFPQRQATVVYEDNMSAINLACAPAIPRKSRHIHIRHHFIRDCVASAFIRIQHLATDLMLADFLTKPFGPKKHIQFRDIYFNTRSIPP